MSNATSTPPKNNWVMMDHMFMGLRKAELLVDNGAEGRGSDEIYLTIRQEVYHEWPGGGPDAELPRRAVDLLAERDVIKDSEDARQDVLRLLTDPRVGENVYGNRPGEPRRPGLPPSDDRLARRLAERLSQQALLKYGLGYSGAAWDQVLWEDAIGRARSAILQAIREDREPTPPDDVWADNLGEWLEEAGVIRPGLDHAAAAEALKEAFRQVPQTG